MDAYDIFKKLTKGLKFKNPVISIKNQDKNATRQAIKQELIEVKKEEEFSDFENSDEGVSDARSESSDDEKDQLELVQGVQVGKRKKKTKDKEKTDDIKKKLIIEEQNRFRNEYGIKAVGRHIPAAIQDFEDLMKLYNVSEKLVKTVRECGYAEPTPIQRQALPCMLERRQIFACAPTGSGKTAAFLIPILHTLGAPQGGPRALILCPTRELAVQIYREALRLSAGTDLRVSVVRKMQESKIKEREATIRKSDIVISTPNRLCYLLNQDNVNIKLDKVRWLIIDEADKLFEGSTETESDFRQQMEQIMSSCDGKERQVAMFSATHTPRVAKWCRHHMRGLINVTVGQRNAAASSVQQELLYCGSENGKLVAFRQLVQKGLNPPVLVFVQSKDRAKQLFKELIYDGINVDVIHADRTQAQRDNVVRSFRIGRIWVLICTELMGRGIDFRGVNLVINYDFPPSAIAYIHRIGRAGRAGQTGKAITFFTQDDVANLRSIAAVIKQSGCAVPEYMLQLKQNQNKRKKLVTKAPRRDDIRTILDKRPDKRKLEDGNEAQQGEKHCKGVETIKSGRNNKQRKIQNGGKFIKNNGSKDGNNKGKVFNKNRKGFSKGEGKENKKNPKQLKKKQRNAFSKKKAKKNVS